METKSRYLGKGVTKAVENVNEIIAPEIIEGEFSDIGSSIY